MTDADPHFVIKGWHVLAAFTAFFALIAGLDTYFAVLAYRSAPGETATNPYEAGLAYEMVLDEREREARLGWRASVRQKGQTVFLDISDPAGAPLRGLSVAGVLRRPATEVGRQSIALHETTPGVYRLAGAQRSGAWDMTVTARDTGTGRLEINRRLQW